MIALTRIEKTYTTGGTATPVLKGIDLVVEKGELVAIMGASGSGKTTLMNILGLLDTATAGAYRFDGQDVTHLPDQAQSYLRNHRIGFVFQLFHLVDRLSVTENVLLPLLYSKSYPKDAKARAARLIELVGLSDRSGYRPTALSGGQQQRVAIARALINEPALILADEPTGNLDSVMGREVLGLLQRLHRDGRTIVIITHDQNVASCASRLIRLSDGRIADDVLQQPAVVF